MTKKKTSLNGFLLIDKPEGVSSFQVVRVVRKSLNMRKVGHAGTLDPFATGLMVVAVGKATRLLSYFLAGEKTYTATLRLGEVSDTMDTEGSITPVSKRIPTLEEVESVLATFKGAQKQVPPQHSALKIDGKRAYDLARAGKEVTLAARDIEIYDITLVSYNYPEVIFTAHVSTGTYIRSLGQDIGAALGVGGYLTALRRTRVGVLSVEQALSWEETLSSQVALEGIYPTGKMPYRFPMIEADVNMRYNICHGIDVEVDVSDLVQGSVVGIVLEGELVAVGEVKKDKVWPRKVFIT